MEEETHQPEIKNSKEVSLRIQEDTDPPCPTIQDFVRQNPHIEILHLQTNDSWEELTPICDLTQLIELDLYIYVLGYFHIFQSDERLQRMLNIAFEKKLPIQRLKLDMEFGYAVNMLSMIAKSLTELKELELRFQYVVATVKDENVEIEDSLRFRTVEKLTMDVNTNPDFGLAVQSIAMFDFDALKEFTLKGLHAEPVDVINFIARQKTLQKLKLIESIEVTVDVFDKFESELAHLKEMMVDMDEQAKEVLEQHLGGRWTISTHSEMFKKKLINGWTFKRNKS